jgi:uncharacterized membrane protein YuzA (DUF378 family)
MAQTNMTDGVTYIVIGFITVFFILLISNMASVISNSEHNELTDSSKEYMSKVSTDPNSLGFNTSVYNQQIDNPLGEGGADNKNEFSLDFTFGLKSANKLTRFVYAVISLPKFVINGLFGFNLNDFNWIIDLLNWLWRILIFVAIIYFIRGR